MKLIVVMVWIIPFTLLSIEPDEVFLRMKWTEKSPTNNTDLTSDWKIKNNVKFDWLEIRYFRGAKCNNGLTSFKRIAGSTTTDNSITGIGGSRYSYKLRGFNSDLGVLTSNCSQRIRIDLVAPLLASNLIWENNTIVNEFPLRANWTRSESKDIKYQRVNYFNLENCLGESFMTGLPEDIKSENMLFPTFEEGIYSFSITTVDRAGNSSTSACSPNSTIEFIY